MFIHLFVFPSLSLNWGQVFALKFMTLHYKDHLMDFIYIWHAGRYRSEGLLSDILITGPGLEVKVTDLEFLCKSQNCKGIVYIYHFYSLAAEASFYGDTR